MTNDTLELLETIACERQQALDRTDPEQRALEQEYRTQWAAFLREHRHNRRLRQEVLQPLLYAQPAQYRAYSCAAGAFLPPTPLPSTPLTIFRTRSTSPPKSACPGVSMMLIFTPL